jgi:hypothetical protein
MMNTKKYIWYADGKDYLHDGIKRGWYFQNECEMLEGPYSSEQEAENAMTEYGNNL